MNRTVQGEFSPANILNGVVMGDEEQSQSLDTQEQNPDAKSSDEKEKEAVEKLKAEAEGLRKQLAAKDSTISDYENLLKKIQADFDNYRKRVEREREEYSKLVNERLVKKCLNILDDLERGLRDSNGNGNYEAFRAGVEKIKNNTIQLLTEEGLREIPTDGRFDPYYHEAIVVEEGTDGEENRIIEVYQKGYTLNGKVIRPAKVRVSRSAKNNEIDNQR
ncbi:MAG: nucleotide exchange factor GrpE [Methanomassiliicoccales archaeon]